MPRTASGTSGSSPAAARPSSPGCRRRRSAGRRCSPSRAPAPSRTPCRSPGRLDNGVLSVAVAADGTLSLGGGRGCRPPGRRRRRGRQLQLRAARGRPPRRGARRGSRLGPRGGPVRGALSIVRSYRWSPAEVPVEVETTVELRAGERSAVCASRSRTRSPIIGPVPRPAPARARSSAAEGQFAVVERASRPRRDSESRPADLPRLRLRRRRRDGGAARAPDGVRARGGDASWR